VTRWALPPRFSVFEALISAIACQQLSLHVGIELRNRLAKICGRVWAAMMKRCMLSLAGRPCGGSALKLRTIGFSSNKADAIITLSGIS
jgi:DNA-3-methyladenine glycosylase II